MRLNVYRTHDGFVVSPECMQAPLNVQRVHRARFTCGILDLPSESVALVLDAVMRDGYALIRPNDHGYVAIERICAEMNDAQA